MPYRESKVTHIFRDVLHGWGRLVLSVSVSPSASDYDETHNVLKVRKQQAPLFEFWQSPSLCSCAFSGCKFETPASNSMHRWQPRSAS